MTFANTEQAELWAARASSWMSLESYHEQVIGPAGRMAMDRLDPQPGPHVVDLGAGRGRRRPWNWRAESLRAASLSASTSPLPSSIGPGTRC